MKFVSCCWPLSKCYWNETELFQCLDNEEVELLETHENALLWSRAILHRHTNHIIHQQDNAYIVEKGTIEGEICSLEEKSEIDISTQPFERNSIVIEPQFFNQWRSPWREMFFHRIRKQSQITDPRNVHLKQESRKHKFIKQDNLRHSQWISRWNRIVILIKELDSPLFQKKNSFTKNW